MLACTSSRCLALTGGLFFLAPLTAAAAPGFVSADRHDDQSRAGAEVTYAVPGDFANGADGITLVRVDVHGHYVDPGSHIGGYLSLPLLSVDGTNVDTTTLGNLELGGLYVVDSRWRGLAVVLRAGLALPTAYALDHETIGSILPGALRPGDHYATLLRGSTLRLAVSPTLRAGIVFARIDAGIDVNFYLANRDDPTNPGLRFNLATGLDLGPAAVTAELATVTYVGGEAPFSFAVGSLGVRGALGRVQPYAGFHVGLTNEVTNLASVGFTAGVDVGF